MAAEPLRKRAWYRARVDRTFQLPTCRLRAWRETDLASLVRHADDPRVAATVRDHFPSPYTREDGRRWLAHAAGLGLDTSLAIEVDGAAVGGVGMIAGEDVHRVRAEIGYWLGHAYWGRGIMTDAVRAYSEHLLFERGFLRLEAPVFAINPASARVLEKAGFERESVQRRAAIKAGVLMDVWLFVRLA
ncbi:MAG: GNAT family N-acetyltransferase [Sandaracinaceae bacterium]|nr:GNAT family N-acetyltransferase [Sandaracinaceae bacterium]